MGAPQTSGPSFLAGSPGDAEIPSTQTPSILATDNGTIYVLAWNAGAGGGNITGMSVYKPSNAGRTAFTQLDSANTPTNATAACVYDAVNRQFICGAVVDTFPQTAQPLFLKNFSTASETWGANYATGGPNALTLVQATFKRPDTSIVVIYKNATQGGGTTNLRAAVWNGSSWSSSIDIGTALLPFDATGNINVGGAVAAMDSTGLIHVAFINNAGGGSDMIYQQLKTDNTLGNSFHWTTASLSMSNGASGLGNMIVSGPNVLISYSSNAFTNNALQLGTPLANPVFSTVTPASLAQPAGQVNFAGPLATDGMNLVWMINSLDATFTYTFFQLAKSTDNGNTWAILTDNQAANYFYNFAPGGSTQAPNADPTFGTNSFQTAVLNLNGTATVFGFCNVRNTPASLLLGYLLNSEAIGSSPPSKFEISLFGTKRFGKSPEPECVVAPEPEHVTLFK